jgi:hypothetical protein
MAVAQFVVAIDILRAGPYPAHKTPTPPTYSIKLF